MTTIGLLSRKIAEKKKFVDVNITFDGAKIQDGKGNRHLGTEAAHNLPRNILINGCSIWEYANDPECNFHTRIKRQLFYSSASAVVVKREANYIDSQWELNGLVNVFIRYLNECVKIKIGEEDELKFLLLAGKNLIEGCAVTLDITKNIIKERKTYQKKKSELDVIFDEYIIVIKEFDYTYFIEKWLNVYRLPKYK